MKYWVEVTLDTSESIRIKAFDYQYAVVIADQIFHGSTNVDNIKVFQKEDNILHTLKKR